MERKGIPGLLTAVLLISLVAGARDAPAVVNFRSLIPERDLEEKSNTPQASPSPSPILPLKSNPPNNSSPNSSRPGQNQTDAGKLNSGNPKNTPPSGSPSVPLPSSSSNPAPASGDSPSIPATKSGSPSNTAPPSPSKSGPASGSPSNPAPNGPVSKPPPLAPKSTDGSDDSRGKVQENKICNSPASLVKCHDGGKNLFACLQHTQTESQKLFLLVQNEGESPLTVNVLAPPTLKNDIKPFQLPKHESKKIPVLTDSASSLQIVLNSGNGDCILKLQPPISMENFFQQLPNYASRVTPIYGAYVLSLTVVIAGGTWACCKFRKKGGRADSGVPYQQLEMGIQQQSTPVVDDTADGWDQGWDDDWDEEAAVANPPDRQAGGSVSVNGVASRSSDKNGWEDWDD